MVLTSGSACSSETSAVSPVGALIWLRGLFRLPVQLSDSNKLVAQTFNAKLGTAAHCCTVQWHELVFWLGASSRAAHRMCQRALLEACTTAAIERRGDVDLISEGCPCCLFVLLPTGTLDGIIDTVSAEHDLNAVLALLAPRGQYVMVGLPPNKPTINHVAIVQKCLSMSGSAVGNAGMTQDMLNFCGEKGITADVEVGVQHWYTCRVAQPHNFPRWPVRKTGFRAS